MKKRFLSAVLLSIILGAMIAALATVVVAQAIQSQKDTQQKESVEKDWLIGALFVALAGSLSLFIHQHLKENGRTAAQAAHTASAVEKIRVEIRYIKAAVRRIEARQLGIEIAEGGGLEGQGPDEED